MEEDKKVNGIHTYMSDMVNAVKEDETTVIKIALEEKNKREKEEMIRKAEGTKTQKILFFVGGLILIIVSIFGAYYFYKKNIERNTPIIVDKNIETYITYESGTTLDVSEIDNSQSTWQKIKSVKDNLYNYINLFFINKKIKDANGLEKNQLIATKDFFSLIKSGAPSDLINSLSDKYALGVYQKDPTAKLANLIILETNDYNSTYVKMLEWEKTILNDLAPIFGINLNDESLTYNFKDVIFKNKEARALYDSNDNLILIYLITNDDKIIITDSEDTLSETMTRLLSKNTK